MPLYKIAKEKSALEAILPTTFEQVQVRERKHLQAMLRDNPSVLGDDLLIIAEEYSNWQDSQRRIDLLAINKEANLVVIELKRANDPTHDLQAIRYAAMLSAMEFDAVVETYEQFLRKHPVAGDQRGARERLLEFLERISSEEPSIGSTPCIVLVAPDFSIELTTTVLWLNDNDLDIKCLKASPYAIGSDLFLSVEQIIPLPLTENYVVALGKKMRKSEQQMSAQRRENSIPILIANGILKEGMRLKLIKSPRSGVPVDDDKATGATFLSRMEVKWDYDENVYSLSKLCNVLWRKFGGTEGSGVFAGPDYWAIEGEKKSLSERAKELQSVGNGINLNNGES